MGPEPPLHRAAVRGEVLLTELGGEVGRTQHDAERVDDEPLLALLKDVAEQGFVDRVQLARRDRMGGHLLALKELVLGVHLPNLLLLPHKRFEEPTQSSRATELSDLPSCTSCLQYSGCGFCGSRYQAGRRGPSQAEIVRWVLKWE